MSQIAPHQDFETCDRKSDVTLNNVQACGMHSDMRNSLTQPPWQDGSLTEVGHRFESKDGS